MSADNSREEQEEDASLERMGTVRAIRERKYYFAAYTVFFLFLGVLYM